MAIDRDMLQFEIDAEIRSVRSDLKHVSEFCVHANTWLNEGGHTVKPDSSANAARFLACAFQGLAKISALKLALSLMKASDE